MGYDITGAYDDQASSADQFDIVPEGTYQAHIIDAKIEDISRQNSYGTCLVLTWEIIGSNADGRRVWQRINLFAEGMNNLQKVRDIANAQFAKVRAAIGFQTPETPNGKPFSGNTDDLLQRQCSIKVGIKRDKNGQYPDQNTVTPIVGASAAPAPRGPAPSGPAPSGNGNAPPIFQRRAG